jgi:catechol 2,3-dioxygenase-like lactoylglutathione lyase family enzyme
MLGGLMANDSVIPLLPCVSLEETLDFYRALGFEVTHEQTWPYAYGSVFRNGVNLHFYGGFKGFNPAKAYSS